MKKEEGTMKKGMPPGYRAVQNLRPGVPFFHFSFFLVHS